MKGCNNIAAHRRDCGLTQEELAAKIYVTQQLVSAWENQTRRPSRENLRLLSEVFGCPEKEIYTPDGDIFSEISGYFPPSQLENPSDFINGFLGKLSKNERMIFIRRYYFTEEISEIAERFGIKENNVRAVLSKTRKKLKKYVKENCYE